MKWITFGCSDEEAQNFANDAKATGGLIAYVDTDGDEIEVQTTNLEVSDTDPRD